MVPEIIRGGGVPEDPPGPLTVKKPGLNRIKLPPLSSVAFLMSGSSLTLI